jgi:hypothetical protein
MQTGLSVLDAGVTKAFTTESPFLLRYSETYTYYRLAR